MKSMVSTIIVFGFIFIIILGGAFLFQQMHGIDTIKDADMKINNDIHGVIDNGTSKIEDNITEDNITEDNITEDNTTEDNITEDNITEDNTTADNVSGAVQ